MQDQKKKARIFSGWYPFPLESRSLPAAGMGAIFDVVRDLGAVTATAATRGVEATASIPAGAAVTFRISLQAAGDYTLLVRHTGDDLTLQAQGPTGTATIDPGVAGPFRIVPLSLQARTYEVTATARGGAAVFVDWELLLNNGVGQAGSTAIGSLVPAVAFPVSGSSASPPGLSTPASTASIPAPVATSFEPLVAAQGEMSVGSIARGMMGHPAMHHATVTEPMAVDSIGSLAHQTLTSFDPALVVTMQALPGEASNQRATPAAAGDGWAPLFPTNPPEMATEATAGESAGESLLTDLTIEPTDLGPAEDRISLASTSPGLLLGAIAVAVAYRARPRGNRPGFGRTTKSRTLTSMEATIRWDDATLDRS